VSSFADEVAAARRRAARVGAAHFVGESLRSLKRALLALAVEDCTASGDTITTVAISVESGDSTGRAADVAAMIPVLESLFADLEAAWRRPIPRG